MAIYTTGAYLSPKQLENGSWIWMVAQFEDDTFKDGDTWNPPEWAETEEQLMVDTCGED